MSLTLPSALQVEKEKSRSFVGMLIIMLIVLESQTLVSLVHRAIATNCELSLMMKVGALNDLLHVLTEHI